MSDKEDGGQAFPLAASEYAGHGPQAGMSLRDYFAAQAMQAIVIGNQADECTMGAGCAMDAYRLADAMLAERAK